MAAVDWFGAAEIAAPAPSRPRRAPKAAPAVAPRRRVRAGRPVGGWIVWISVFAVLLAGVVAVNVAVLRANIDMNKLNQQTTQLQEQNAALASQVSAASSSLRIEAAARRLGLVPAPATDTSYVNLGTAK